MLDTTNARAIVLPLEVFVPRRLFGLEAAMFFDIPAPDELILVSWFEGGEVFRSGCTYHRGNGKIFYFRPGHEAYPTFYDTNVLKVISNGVRWAALQGAAKPVYGNHKPLEKIKLK